MCSCGGLRNPPSVEAPDVSDAALSVLLTFRMDCGIRLTGCCCLGDELQEREREGGSEELRNLVTPA